MTEFQKIQNELISLGWSVQNGRGDHKLFRKAGKQVSVSMSLSSVARNYKNKLAEIRRLEPAFALGKPAKSKADQRSEQILNGVLNMTDSEKATARKYVYIAEGHKVRYTSPEKRDWSKLNEPGSVMNVPYSVFEIISESGRKYVTSEQDTVVITDENLSHEIRVKPPELDAWETKTCKGCGKDLPMNLFTPGENLCVECTKQVGKLTGDIKESVSSLISDNKLPLSPTMKGWKVLPRELQELLEKNEDEEALRNLPTEELVTHYRNLKEELEKFLISQTGKKLASDDRKTLGAMRNAAAVACGDKKISLYEASRLFSGRLACCNCAVFRNLEGVTEKDIKNFKKRVYEISLTKDERDGLTIVNVCITSPLVLYAAIAHSESLYNVLEGTFTKEDVFVVKFFCKALGYEQFIPYRDAFVTQTLECLKENCSEEELADTCDKLRNITSWNEGIYRDIADAAISTAVKMKRLTDAEADNIKVGLTRVYAGDPNNAECVKEFYLHSRYSTVGILYVTDECEEPEKTADALRSVVKSIYAEMCKDIGDEYVRVHVTNNPNEDNPDGAVCEFRTMEPEPEITLSVKLAGDIVPRLEEKGEGDAANGIIAVLKEWEESFGGVFCPDGKAPATKEPAKKSAPSAPCTDEPCTLDATNPASDNESLRNVTIREMLVELKKRGVEFNGVSVPVVVRQAINLEDL